MALSGFKAQNHPQQVSRRWPDDVDGVDDRATHPLDFAAFTERLGPFTLDVAAAHHNTKCERYLIREQDGLAQDWTNPPLWIGPPCLMCDGTGVDREADVLPRPECRACNGHGRQACEVPVRERIWCNPPFSDIAPWVWCPTVSDQCPGAGSWWKHPTGGPGTGDDEYCYKCTVCPGGYFQFYDPAFPACTEVEQPPHVVADGKGSE